MEYRVVRTKIRDGVGLSLCEVFFDTDGNPSSRSELDRIPLRTKVEEYEATALKEMLEEVTRRRNVLNATIYGQLGIVDDWCDEDGNCVLRPSHKNVS